MSFPCPECGEQKRTKVIDVRFREADCLQRRRHECDHCGARYNTIEILGSHYEILPQIRDLLSRLPSTFNFNRERRRGYTYRDDYDVPEEKRADFEFLHYQKGLTWAEAADIIGAKRRDHTIYGVK